MHGQTNISRSLYRTAGKELHYYGLCIYVVYAELGSVIYIAQRAENSRVKTTNWKTHLS